MSHRKPALLAAALVAVVVGIPVTVVALQQSAAAQVAEEEARQHLLAAMAATSQVNHVVDGAAGAASRYANRTANARIQVEGAAVPAAAAVVANALAITEVAPAVRERLITLGPDQTWQNVADVWGLSGTELAALNPETDLNTVQAGDALRVYRYRAALQSRSVGPPNRGRVINAMPMPDGDHWIVRRVGRSWGTSETVSHLVRGVSHVGTVIPSAGIPLVADISAKRGGRVRPHRSHTSGRDVDATYYQTNGRTSTWEHVSSNTLDVAAQWELFRYWIERDLLVYIFIEHRLSRALHEYAVSIGDDPALIEAAFGEERGRGILRYAPGHDDHFHARFRCREDDGSCREH